MRIYTIPKEQPEQQLQIQDKTQQEIESLSKFDNPYSRGVMRNAYIHLTQEEKYALRRERDKTRRKTLTQMHIAFYDWLDMLVARTRQTHEGFGILFLTDLLSQPKQMMSRYRRREGILPRRQVLERLQRIDWELDFNNLPFDQFADTSAFYYYNEEYVKLSDTTAARVRDIHVILKFPKDRIVQRRPLHQLLTDYFAEQT